MKFESVIKEKLSSKGNLVLGFNVDGLLTIDIKDHPSILITGETGIGKSVFLNQVLLELCDNYDGDNMNIIAIDTSGVELQRYLDSHYSLEKVFDKPESTLAKVLNIIDERKALFNEEKVNNYDEYYKKTKNELPLIVVAVDDNDSLLNREDMEKIISGIITNVSGLNMLFVLATSSLHNKFFEKDFNLYSSVRISFDTADEESDELINLNDVQTLPVGMFKIVIDDKELMYYNFDFDESIFDKLNI